MNLNPWVFILFSLIMGVAIMVVPYIITILDGFNKEKLLIWRKVLSIIFVCYMPVIALFYAVYFISIDITLPSRSYHESILFPWWIGCYFGYIICVIFIKKRTDLQLGWFKYIFFATAGYLIVTILLLFLSMLFNDPLIDLFARSSINYVSRNDLGISPK